jgi:hypothetical protein
MPCDGILGSTVTMTTLLLTPAARTPRATARPAESEPS